MELPQSSFMESVATCSNW